jgi:tyrosyl-tRNA synthetase
LAEEITRFVHGKNSLSLTIQTTERLFSNQTIGAENLSIEDLESMEEAVKSDFAKERISAGIDIVSFLAETNIFPSKGEARKMIEGGGVSINRKKIDNVQLAVDNSLLLHEKYILVQKGKKNYYLVKAV